MACVPSVCASAHADPASPCARARANVRACQGKGAGKISPAHVLEALEELGLSSLIEPVKALDAATRESVEDRLATKRKRKQAGAGEMTEEEAMRLQQELFAKARAKVGVGAVCEGIAFASPYSRLRLHLCWWTKRVRHAFGSCEMLPLTNSTACARAATAGRWTAAREAAPEGHRRKNNTAGRFSAYTRGNISRFHLRACEDLRTASPSNCAPACGSPRR